jgi:hypothetical protein
MTKPLPPSLRACIECGVHFTASRNRRICSDDCARLRRLATARAYYSRTYEPATGQLFKDCARCGSNFRAYRSNSLYCGQGCKLDAASDYASDRSRRLRAKANSCYKCSSPIERRPGVPGRLVCDGCRVDPRIKGARSEHRRRARLYGLTVEQLDNLLALNACAACGSDAPGPRGWQVDHDHACCAGHGSCGSCVRGLLCMSCNTAIGLAGDDPDRLLAMATYIERTRARQLRLVV